MQGFKGHGGGMSVEIGSSETFPTVILDSIVFESNNAESVGSCLDH